MTQRKKIFIIYTGGTIGMIENPELHALEPFDFDHLIDNVPKIKMLDYEISNFQFAKPIDSSAMNPSHWAEIAEVIEQKYDEVDGFVVLHGTDTMAYTASALSFMLENLNKPVIVTGSQLPIGEVRTDGEENLITALQIAAAEDENGEPMVREVAILFENYLWRGNRSTKSSADNFNAFKSNNYPELARIGLDINFKREYLWRGKVEGKLKVKYPMDTNVMFLTLFPGISELVVRHVLSTPGIKGVVLKSFGAGNAPNEAWFLDVVRQAIERGVVVVNITQCTNGCVMPMRYVTGKELSDAGCVSGYDLTSEAAITKLMYLLGQGLSAEEVKRQMATSLCGEMTI
ncbi:MAG: type I asparaginase [Muribaculaceae bacterium]|jgi:L-asparaginase|nr:type I asparaginase [Muribaculaceae bacterium]MBQ1185783.1 type I asparaginase [Muribaculaceae bacterium]MBQ2398673.1 type I asparaginase [Muribaculaceae bacterium]MBQ2440054.1 type I asparaginase [Muribaculaceae bacterium]MBQ5722842.1 type I asparaginase [Muribaculaceae bacterium]